MNKIPPLTQDEIDGLSPGVRDLVVDMREAGFYTTDSGDGSNYAAGMECAVPFKMVAVLCGPLELAQTADRLASWLIDRGLDWPAWRVEASYNPGDGTAIVLLSESSDEQLDRVEAITGVRPRGMW